MFGKMSGRSNLILNLVVISATLALGHALSAQTPELDLAQKQIDTNDLSAAAATLESYLKEHPASAAAWIKRGNIADLARDNHTALADYDRAEKNGVPPALLTYRRARSYMSLQNNEAALAQLELAITNGVSLGPKLDDKVFDPIPSTPRFKTILAQNDLILHPCADAPHRAFDFWVGDWTVTTQNGPKVGDSSIKRILNDCVILESWTGAGGGTGQSFNNYDARNRTWKQFWVDASGSRQEYDEGVYKDGALRFTGHNPGPKGELVQQRFTFFNVDPNHVRQLQEQSTDGGKTWTVVYDFYYARKNT
jgi:tetratricopeptide (TPR) repeat protein